MPLIPLFIGGAGDGLTVQDAACATAFDNVTLTQVHNLIVADSSFATLFDNAVLTQVHILIVQDSNCASVFDNVTLQIPAILVVQDWTIGGGGAPVPTPLQNIMILPSGKIGIRANTGGGYIKT